MFKKNQFPWVEPSGQNLWWAYNVTGWKATETGISGDRFRWRDGSWCERNCRFENGHQFDGGEKSFFGSDHRWIRKLIRLGRLKLWMLNFLAFQWSINERTGLQPKFK